MNKKGNMTFGLIDKFVKKLFAEEFHHKQVMSMGLLVLGVLYADRLGVAAIGTGLAKARGTAPKHGIKQFDRFLRNKKMRIADFQKCFATTIVSTRKKILVTMDWTDFDADDHTVLVLSLVTRSKRALPLIWTVVQKSTLKGTRNMHEKTAVQMLRQALPVDVHMTILADRGFGDTADTDKLKRNVLHLVFRSVLFEAEIQGTVPQNGRRASTLPCDDLRFPVGKRDGRRRRVCLPDIGLRDSLRPSIGMERKLSSLTFASC